VLLYDTTLLGDWDHTAVLVQTLHNLNATVNNLLNKKKIKPATFDQVHPFRASSSGGGMKITAANLGSLKGAFRAMAGATKVGRPKR